MELNEMKKLLILLALAMFTTSGYAFEITNDKGDTLNVGGRLQSVFTLQSLDR